MEEYEVLVFVCSPCLYWKSIY